MGENGKKWGKVGKGGENVVKSCEKCGKWLKVGKSSEKWGKVMKSGEKW